jgi:hypothetical protein
MIGACTAARQETTIQMRQHCTEADLKFPAAAEFGDPVRKPLPKLEFPFELFADVTGKNLMLLQAFDDFLVERGKLADLFFQDILDVIFPKLA